MNFGFVSTRFAGTDGVSLEARKWASVLEKMGHRCFWFAGECDHDRDVSWTESRAHFTDPTIESISQWLWSGRDPGRDIPQLIEQVRRGLHASLRLFCERYAIDVIVPQNALTIPMNIPLGLAIADYIAESEISTIAHHHDFFWERKRFKSERAQPYLERAFPPQHPAIAHVVINREARSELASRRGISSIVVPNVMNFEESVMPRDNYAEDLRDDIGLHSGDRLILQPTRIIPRKGIEHAIELLGRLGDPRNKLVLSHDAGDEGFDYSRRLRETAERWEVEIISIADRIKTHRGTSSDGSKIYTLADLYPHADLVTFPSLYEGFGNALLEAMLFRKPILVNRYPVFRADIAPLGFDLAVMDGQITDSIVSKVREFLDSPEISRKAVDHNHALAAKHFGYPLLRKRLGEVINSLEVP